ncbi:MAG: hypothetical protein PVJ66_09690 [Gammaproteobacteria bacterium]|jgi:hypothetical protein
MRIGWLLLALLLAGGIFLYLNPEYRSRLLSSTSDMVSPVSTSRIYKWRNDRGEWQLTDTSPPEGVTFEILEHRSDENVLPRPPQLDNTR